RFGDPITLIALATVTYKTTNSALFTALAVVIASVPTAVFGFFAGAIGDALGARRAMVMSDIGRAVLIAAIPQFLEGGAPLVGDSVEGVRFIFDTAVLRVNTYFSLAAQLALPVVNGLTPVYLVRRFANGDADFGAALFGVAEAALAAGAVAAGLTLPEYMTQ